MPNIAQLQDSIRSLEGQVAALAADGKNIEAAEASGRLAATRERLMDAIARVNAENERLRAAGAREDVHANATVGRRILGDRAAFKGLEDGFRAAAALENAVAGLSTPQIYKYDLPSPIAPPIGFLATLLKGTTDGDEHFFRHPVLTNKAAGWTSGDKPESSIEWTKAVANIETIAHWIPIEKQTARRYSQLDSIVSGALMLGLDLKCNEAALRGSNSSGIVGVANTAGILTHAKRAGKNLKDTFCAMKRKVRVATGIAPNYVCLSPYAIEELSEEKDSTGRYLFPEIANGGTIAGLTVVEDVNMTVVAGEGESAKSTETALVYYNGGASFDIADPQEVTVGLTNSQFIQNQYTILAELTAALRVDMPGCFCYCGDLGVEAED